MKLYDYGTAPNPRKVRIFLAEKGVEYELVQVDMAKREHKSPDFLKMNPSGKVPVLELDDGRYLSESIAICRYLEGVYPQPNLFGVDPFEMGHIEMRNRQMETELWSQIGVSWVNGPVMAKIGTYTQIPEAKTASDANVKNYYERLDRELAASDYIAGSRFTIADITLLAGIDFAATMVGLKPDESLTNLWRWHALVSSRDSVDVLQ
ncbi:MAG TPA: glutathione S-transferase family protein [Gammaproteobacteria bacterium]|jgi:glutathione S-transferase|nr:glutathione S-transferase [Gammaproteobacteria bacterium]HAT27421.1 glutathione S-transferase [Gammaproteobacteria bacterium]HIA59251.1 glutathione S-transferase family protein [Gammaproteobacteria bacterium]HIF85768.1 glutathione S-transferase family protein [Gammaproteobacteria bacterium]HIL62244.1 glutathione S-transferase family protein [Porticoccaceae bacterium]|tara:strand:- start:3686 stop:4306 length:621 start_codon:yes stop_codon:yes gene_type:complete